MLVSSLPGPLKPGTWAGGGTFDFIPHIFPGLNRSEVSLGPLPALVPIPARLNPPRAWLARRKDWLRCMPGALPSAGNGLENLLPWQSPLVLPVR